MQNIETESCHEEGRIVGRDLKRSLTCKAAIPAANVTDGCILTSGESEKAAHNLHGVQVLLPNHKSAGAEFDGNRLMAWLAFIRKIRENGSCHVFEETAQHRRGMVSPKCVAQSSLRSHSRRRELLVSLRSDKAEKRSCQRRKRVRRDALL